MSRRKFSYMRIPKWCGKSSSTYWCALHWCLVVSLITHTPALIISVCYESDAVMLKLKLIMMNLMKALITILITHSTFKSSLEISKIYHNQLTSVEYHFHWLCTYIFCNSWKFFWNKINELSMKIVRVIILLFTNL